MKFTQWSYTDIATDLCNFGIANQFLFYNRYRLISFLQLLMKVTSKEEKTFGSLKILHSFSILSVCNCWTWPVDVLSFVPSLDRPTLRYTARRERAPLNKNLQSPTTSGANTGREIKVVLEVGYTYGGGGGCVNRVREGDFGGG